MVEAQRFLGKVVGEAILSAFFTEVIHTQNFSRTREHLQRGGKVIFYSNHIHRFDSEPVAKAIIEYVGPLDEHTYLMAAMQYRDPDRKENAALVKTTGFMQRAFRFNFVTVVQDKPEEKIRYPKWRRINMDAFNKIVTVLEEEPGAIVYIYPEGTRSQTGALAEAKTGLEKLLERAGSDVIVQPMVIIPPANNKIKPLTMRTRIIVPKPFTYQEILAEQKANPGLSVTDLSMVKLARELSPQYRGFYAQMASEFVMPPESNS